MHPQQPNYYTRHPCPAVDYRWRTDGGIEVLGLPKTRAGTYYIPSDLGVGWYIFENGASSVGRYTRVNLLFRGCHEELWRAARRSAYEFRQLAEPLPEVMTYLLRLDSLRKSVWTIINDGIGRGLDLSIVSPRCRLHSDGYAGLYTPDVELWAFIHTAADVDSAKLTTWTGHTVTTADLKKIIKDALCSDNHFTITPAQLANGTYRLPRLAHYDRTVDMNSVVQWLQDHGMTPFMVHAHFRPFLRRVYDASAGGAHRVYQPRRAPPGRGSRASK
jgi:hypothetical protein